jgi:putative ABC transport system permease protein
VTGSTATPELFGVLGVQAMLGRTFTAEEGESGRGDVVLLSYGLWRSRFGGEREVIGRTMTIDGR